MKLISYLVLGLVLLQAQHTNYYSTVAFVESPYSLLNGSIPLSKAVALKRNHYRFVYNEVNQLIEIGFYLGDQLRDPNHTANLFFQSALIKIRHHKDQISFRYYDRFGQETSIFGDVHQFIYSLDKNGQRKSLHFLDKNRKRIESNWSIYEYQWELQGDGSVIENRFNQEKESVQLRPGFDFYRIRLTYNQLGYIALMQNIDAEGRLVENKSGAAQDRIETNSDGNFLAWNVLDKKHQLKRGNGPNVARGTQSFDQYGYETGIRYYDEQLNPIASAYGYWNSITKFDRFGNMQIRTFLTPDNKATVHEKAGYSVVKLSYDPSGMNRLKLEYFDLAGEKNRSC